MNNENESYELEEMRQQIALLKGKLTEQKIVSEQLLNKTMSNSIDRMKKVMTRQSILVVFALIYCPFGFYYIMGASASLTICVEIILLITGGLHLYANSLFLSKKGLSSDLINYDLKIQRFLKFNTLQFAVGMILVAIMFVWMIVEFRDRLDYIPIMISIAIGGTIGLFISIRYFFIEIRKRSNLIRENIKQIQELRGE